VTEHLFDDVSAGARVDGHPVPEVAADLKIVRQHELLVDVR